MQSSAKQVIQEQCTTVSDDLEGSSQQMLVQMP